jgi:hypothetical protein
MSATPDTIAGDSAPELTAIVAAEPLAEPAAELRLLDPFVGAPAPAPAPHTLRLSVVVPATDAPPTLQRCVAAIKAADDPPAEVVVVEHPRGIRPAAARNRGARLATGDVLVFVDADVEVHHDAFQRIRAMFDEEIGVTALFGSYDDDPAGQGAVSQFRNLLHHHVHQGSPGTVGTFWAGLGAIRREAFVEAGGFVDHPIEDIELGMRLTERGASIVLDPRVQGKHLKVWTVANMVKIDLLVRGAPWIGLALRHRTSPAVLNLGWRHRISAAASVSALGALLLRRPRAAVTALGVFLGLNRSFYKLLLRRTGPRAAAAGIGLHLLHHLTGVAAVPTGIALYVRKRSTEDQCDSDSSA